MNVYTTEKIRNIGLFGHKGAGKTSLAEALLYCSGVTDRLGKVENGNTVADFDPDEIKRCMSVFSALTPTVWGEYKFNIVDTPGFFDFIAETLGALRVTDCAVLVAAANSGISRNSSAWKTIVSLRRWTTPPYRVCAARPGRSWPPSGPAALDRPCAFPASPRRM